MRLFAVFLRPLPMRSLLGTISLSSRSNSRGWRCSSVGQMLAWHAPHILRMLVHTYMPSTRELEEERSEVQDKPQLDESEANQGYSEVLSQKRKERRRKGVRKEKKVESSEGRKERKGIQFKYHFSYKTSSDSPSSRLNGYILLLGSQSP